MQTISEADWKVFRELHAIALERFCNRILVEIAEIAADTDQTSQQRYRAMSESIRRRDRELADTFDDFRRSTALLQLVQIQSRTLLTEDEMARFSSKTRELVEFILSGR